MEGWKALELGNVAATAAPEEAASPRCEGALTPERFRFVIRHKKRAQQNENRAIYKIQRNTR